MLLYELAKEKRGREGVQIKHLKIKVPELNGIAENVNVRRMQGGTSKVKHRRIHG
jgi:hypothetical protein